MTSPDGQQLQETPDAVPGAMVRACERCGTVCSTDQEWCLNCGVRLTEPSQRLPGLRAAGLTVGLAVLLAGGAAAASYAALRGDERSAANVPTTTPAPAVAAAPTATTPPPVATTSTTPPVDGGAAQDPAAADDGAADAPDTTDLDTSGGGLGTSGGGSSSSGAGGSSSSTGTGGSSSGSGGSSTGTGSTGGSGGSSGSGGSGSGGGSSTGTGGSGGASDDAGKDEDDDTSGPITFASGQGSLYDPAGIIADFTDEKAAIDGDASTSWKVTLAEGSNGGFGYVLDFNDPTAVKTLKIVTGTSGVSVKVYGTTKQTLPPDAAAKGWDTLAGQTELKTGSAGTTLTLASAAAGAKKYRHVLVWATKSPLKVGFKELSATR